MANTSFTALYLKGSDSLKKFKKEIAFLGKDEIKDFKNYEARPIRGGFLLLYSPDLYIKHNDTIISILLSLDISFSVIREFDEEDLSTWDDDEFSPYNTL